jgi:hypothetical protein
MAKLIKKLSMVNPGTPGENEHIKPDKERERRKKN